MWTKVGEKIVNFCEASGFRAAVPKVRNSCRARKCCKLNYIELIIYLRKVGFDAAENEPFKATVLPVYLLMIPRFRNAYVM